MDKNMAFWFGLKLWPLDAACRWVCGADPNDADQSPLSNPDPATRPEWVNLLNNATCDTEVEIIEGKGGARGVRPGAFIKWARSNGCGLDAKFDALISASKPETQRKKGDPWSDADKKQLIEDVERIGSTGKVAKARGLSRQAVDKVVNGEKGKAQNKAAGKQKWPY